MFYRENGQFKTSYSKDQQIFPILQDKVAVLALIAFAFIGVPALVDEYVFRAILIPFLILSLRWARMQLTTHLFVSTVCH
jgi:branched-chain amino acid transport system permease protein